MVNILFFRITLGLYALATVLYLVNLIHPRRSLARAAFIVATAGFIFQTGFVVSRGIEAGHHPISNLFEAFNFFSWATMLSFYIVQYRFRMALLGALVLPVALVLMALSLGLDKDIVPLLPALQSNWLGIHTTLAFLGNAFFVLSFIGSALYLIQERELKRRRPGILSGRIPSLDVLDRLHYRSLAVGFPLLTFGIITGAVWAQSAWGSPWSWDPKETWSLITWFIYAAIVHARMTVGWRGRKAAYLSLVGFAALLFTFLGVNLILGGLHTYN